MCVARDAADGRFPPQDLASHPGLSALSLGAVWRSDSMSPAIPGLAGIMREHMRHAHPDPLPLRGRGSCFDPLAPGGGEGQGEGVHRTRNTRS
jgi:hypothetical protein